MVLRSAENHNHVCAIFLRMHNKMTQAAFKICAFHPARPHQVPSATQAHEGRALYAHARVFRVDKQVQMTTMCDEAQWTTDYTGRVFSSQRQIRLTRNGVVAAFWADRGDTHPLIKGPVWHVMISQRGIDAAMVLAFIAIYDRIHRDILPWIAMACSFCPTLTVERFVRCTIPPIHVHLLHTVSK